MGVIDVSLGGRSYEVRVGHSLFEQADVELAQVLDTYRPNRSVPIIADQTAKRLHGLRLATAIERDGGNIEWFDVAAGESSKSWETLEQVVDWLLALGVQRSDTIIALGGGVTGDLAGFAAAIVKRGCRFVQLPTTMLAQVDSSVGGKTAINTAAGKNLVGAFHQPSLVLADLTCLATLPERELRAGYAEILKYGILGSADFFDWLENNGRSVLALEPAALEHAVTTSIIMKAAIVADDERETSGKRALLNLGHTFGHALEAETGFSNKLLHGEAVALGMALAARYSVRLGLLKEAEQHRLTGALDAVGLPSEIAALGFDCDGATLVRHMRHDKKMTGATLPFILLNSLGEAFVANDVDLGDVAAFLNEELQAH